MSVPAVPLSEADALHAREPSTYEERAEIERRQRYLYRRLLVIARQYLTRSEQHILFTYLYSNHGLRDLAALLDRESASERYKYRHEQLARERLERIVDTLRLFVEFFDAPYKKCIQRAREVLTAKQFDVVDLYLHTHSYRKCSLMRSCTLQAVQQILTRAVEQLTAEEITKPLAVLVERLRGDR